jgi:ABC-2 type transport system permease protein
MRNIGILFKREFASYFATPLAFVFIVIFLILAGVFAFFFGNFYERGQADLAPSLRITPGCISF